jgi:uncharacterized protein YfcZ (UPF0381/DUF406 family)
MNFNATAPLLMHNSSCQSRMANRQENSRQELEARIVRYRRMQRQVDSLTAARIQSLIEELENLLQDAKSHEE